MKKDIHPTYNTKAKVVCACGNTFDIGSTQPTLRVELCNACHPFYTGKQKFVDTARRVEKFQAKVASKPSARMRSKAAKNADRKVKRAAKKATA